MNGLPVRDSDDGVLGAWAEFEIERNGERTYTNTFFTSLRVWADNVAAIAPARRARWRIEDEGFNRWRATDITSSAASGMAARAWPTVIQFARIGAQRA